MIANKLEKILIFFNFLFRYDNLNISGTFKDKFKFTALKKLLQSTHVESGDLNMSGRYKTFFNDSEVFRSSKERNRS